MSYLGLWPVWVVWSRHCCLSLGLLSTSPTTRDCTFVVRCCRRENGTGSPGLYLVSTGLLQRTAVWRLWRSDPAPAVCAKSGSVTDHWGSLATPALVQYWDRLTDNELTSGSQYWCTVSLRRICRTTEVGRRHLRSADVHTCAVPRTQARLDDRSFTVAGPRLWNNLTVWTSTARHTTASSGDYWGCSCFADNRRSMCAVYKYTYLLTYLLTYFLTIWNLAMASLRWQHHEHCLNKTILVQE